MDLTLAKCARCGKLFNKILFEVCVTCQPAEEEDYRRIRDVLALRTNLNAEQVAAEVGVEVECVTRMLREGRIENVAHDEKVTCGQCGAPAISSTKRLCKRCLVKLDRECARVMQEMRARVLAKQSSEMNDVTEAVESRRATRREKRRQNGGAVSPTSSPIPGRRMVAPNQLRRGGGEKKA